MTDLINLLSAGMETCMPKKCSCGLVHLSIPAIARVMAEGDICDGYYWECACGSTLFAPLKQDDRKAA